MRPFDRWYKGYWRRRDARRLAHYHAPWVALVKLAARILLLVLALTLAGLTALMLCALCGTTAAQAQPIPTEQPPPLAQRYRLTLRQSAHLGWGLDAPVATFAAQVHQESRWRADARSPVGAQGLAQFMPATAGWLNGLDRLDADTAAASMPTLAAPTNPTWALRALVHYDRWLWLRIPGALDDCQRMAFVLSAYNGGLGWVYKRQRLGLRPGACLGATCRINPGISPASQRENEHYAQVILQAYQAIYLPWGPGVRCDG